MKALHFFNAKTEDINKIINSLDSDSIPIKVIKTATKIADSHLTNVLNEDRELNSFSEFAKVVSVRPLYKKGERCKIKNYRPVSILNVFSKIYETYLFNCLTVYSPFVNKVLSAFVSAHRKSFVLNHILARLIEDWKESLDNINTVRAVLIDL